MSPRVLILEKEIAALKKSMSLTLINFSDIAILGIVNILKQYLSLNAIFLSATVKLVCHTLKPTLSATAKLITTIHSTTYCYRLNA